MIDGKEMMTRNEEKETKCIIDNITHLVPLVDICASLHQKLAQIQVV
jgi:hypothetical protein